MSAPRLVPIYCSALLAVLAGTAAATDKHPEAVAAKRNHLDEVNRERLATPPLAHSVGVTATLPRGHTHVPLSGASLQRLAWRRGGGDEADEKPISELQPRDFLAEPVRA